MQKTGPSPTFEHRLRLFASRIILASQARVFFLLFSLTWFAIVSCVSPSGAGFSKFSVVVLSFLLAFSTSSQYARFDRCKISFNALRLLQVLHLKILLFIRWISFFACLSDDFLVEFLFCHFLCVWGSAAFLFCIKFVDDFLSMYLHVHKAFSGFATFKFSIKYFKGCFAPHHRLSSQTVAFDIEHSSFSYCSVRVIRVQGGAS